MLKLKEFLQNKKKIAIVVVILLLGILIFFVVKKVFHSDPRYTYEVAVMVRNQNNSNPKEDQKTSLKIGDVLLTQKEGHKWSKTEKASYLILRMDLTEEQAQKIVEPVSKKLSKKEIKAELAKFKQGREDIKKEELTRYEEELKQRTETVVMRKYRINMEKYFSDFKANDLIRKQPFKDQIFGWKIVEKK